MRANCVKYLPQCNLQYENVNVTSFFQRDESEKATLRFEPSNKSGKPPGQLCSTLSSDPCPDYLMRPYPDAIVPLESQFIGAPAFFFEEVFYVNLYPDEALKVLASKKDDLMPMSEQIDRLKKAEWIGF